VKGSQASQHTEVTEPGTESVATVVMAGKTAAKRQPLSLRAKLVLCVNAVLASVTLFLLVIDYHQEMRSRIRQQQIALAEEARTLLHAVVELRRHGYEVVQTYIDAVCGSMREDQSPGHHIAASIGGVTVQALAHGRASSAMLAALERGAAAPDRQAKLDSMTLVVASASEGDTTVYVAESLSHIQATVFREVLWRLAAIAVVAGLVAVVINVALLRLVARPIERLASTVALIARGVTGVQVEEFGTAELATLADAINSMSRALDQAERERKLHLEKARRVQQHFIPRLDVIQGVRAAYIYRPAADVAGDCLHVLQRPDGSVLVCVADVSGHGIAAALESAVLRTLFVQAAEACSTPEAILDHMNRQFTAVSLPEDFATAFVAAWDSSAKRLTYASAGHEPAYLVSDSDSIHELRATGLPLGIGSDAQWSVAELPTRPGDRLFVVTDGLVETRGPGGAMFGRARLKALLGQLRNAPVDAAVAEVERIRLEFRDGRIDSDDVTLLAVEFQPCSVSRGPSGQAEPSRPSDSNG